MTGLRRSRVVGARSGVLIAAGTIAGVLVLAGCGGGGSKTAATGSTTPAASPAVSAATSSAGGSDRPRNTAAIAAYTACLQQHGVTVPSFSRGARAACASLLPAGGFGGGRGAAISATTFAAFKSCMADKGVTITVTDPQQALRALDRTVAATAAALKVCQPILGTGAASGPPAAAPTPSAAASS